MNVTVAEVLAGADVRAVPLSAECVGYLVLAAADQVGAAPRRIAPSDLLLFEDGAVRVANGRAAEGSVAEADLRSVLDSLLLRASGPTSGLLRASRRRAGAGVEALVRELETALIPVNRAAAKRALARLERETVRALESGRISLAPAGEESEEPSTAAPPVTRAAKLEPSAPPPEVAPEPEPSVAPPEVSVRPEPSAPLPEVSVEPHSAVAVDVVAWSPVPDAATGFAVQEHTVVLAPVAPKAEPEPPLAETRPEPVVLRASQRPPAPPVSVLLPEPISSEPVRTEPLPSVAPARSAPLPIIVAPPEPELELQSVSELPPLAVSVRGVIPNVTPVLGTRVASNLEPMKLDVPAEDELEIFVEEDAEDDALFEVIFEPEEQTMLPADEELIVSQGADWTEPCPPIEAESMLPPPALASVEELVAPSLEVSAPAELSEPSAEPVEPIKTIVVEASAPGVEEAEPVVAEASVPEVEEAEPVVAEASAPELDDAERELAETSEPPRSVDPSELPPWATVVAEAADVTPPPRVALPEPRRSDVEDLLLRLAEVPLEVDELRSGLKRLAGMEPTPPPPGIARGD